MTPLEKRFWSKVDRRGPEECWPWKGAKQYATFWMNGKIVGSHRVAFELHYRKAPGAALVCHSCDNPPCCNPAHLFLGTNTSNRADAKNKNRLPAGEKASWAKLSTAAIREIRSSTLSSRQLARRFNVSRGAILHVLARRTWKQA